MDKANTCQRSQCECDKALAYDLSDKEYMWSLMNHRDWSIFDADTRCTVQEKEKFYFISKLPPYFNFYQIALILKFDNFVGYSSEL